MNDQNEQGEYQIVMSEEMTTGTEAVKSNPWRDPFSLIAWGFLLTSFTLNFLLLQYILPTIGFILLYLGFRSLRKVNLWFQIAWTLSVLKLILHLLYLMMSATPMISIYTTNNNLVLGSTVVIMQLALLFTYRIALQTVYRKAGIKPMRDPALGMIICLLVMSICAFTAFANNWIVIIMLIIFYISLIHSLYQLGDDLGAASDAFIEAPVKVGDRVVTWGYLIICMISVMISCVFANHLTLDASNLASVNDNEIRAKLNELGFPKYVLVDISDTDLELLNDAYHVEFTSGLLDFNQYANSSGNSIKESRDILSGSVMQTTTVYVELPDKYLYVIVHFNWKDNNVYWQDGFTIWGENGFELLNGVLLFKKNGIDYSAPIPRLKCEEVTTNNWFISEVSRQISGAVNYPLTSKDQRGYIFYRFQLPVEPYFGKNCFNYMHNTHPFHFPYQEVEDIVRKELFNKNVKQFYTNFNKNAY